MAAIFTVDSQTERGVKYLVNMELGICSCNAGSDGSPCSHQAAIVKHYHFPSVNCVPTLSPESRHLLASIALGSNSIQNPQFYSSLHENSFSNSTPAQSSELSFDGSSWDLVRGLASVKEDTDQIGTDIDKDDIKYEDIIADIEEVFSDMKVRIIDSVVVAQGTKTFLKRYKEMINNGKFSNAALGSALYKFGWSFGGRVKSTQGGHFRRGHRIPVSAKAAGRRRGNSSRGKAKASTGRPKDSHSASQFSMKPKRIPKGKRLHSLKDNICKGTQNGGKW